MRPETPLVIYELRAIEGQTADFLSGPPEPEERFGPDFLGLHFEGDFAFLFFTNDYDLSPFLGKHPFLEVRQIHRLRYDQWQDGAAMEPVTIGTLSVWPADSDRKIITPKGSCPPLKIDPGLAFGFGGHPTTKACLGFLVRLLAPGITQAHIPKTALDLGTGTGVLALAAASLGVPEVLGVDHSHMAAKCAANNVLLNNMSQRVRIERGLAQDYSQAPGELVLANMPLFVLMELLVLDAFMGRDYLIYSGLLTGEGQIFLEELGQKIGRPFKIIDSFRDDRWVSGLIDFRA
ncbi:MAG: 50S ribosomal protein L11 methyltransferase [Deltaproteobacteria bacterium]|jgi:ribosomal protein L11 methyltransferase|nr:50S ribosomal protein L11 methyltransferase [Deltaproteobacteria bacterium]